MLGGRRKPVPEGRIEKPEDRAWKGWFDKLDVKEHEKYLQQLGLNSGEIEEWGQTMDSKNILNNKEEKKKKEL